MQRRKFLEWTGIGGLSLLLPHQNLFPYNINNKTLVMIELKGGNDGLNTVVPYSDPKYYELRPRIAIPKDKVLNLNGSVGLNPSLEGLKGLWSSQEMAVILGLGYESPNRSHFRSIDIWETASPSDEYFNNGWISEIFSSMNNSTSIADGVILGSTDEGPLSGKNMRNVVISNINQFARRKKDIDKLKKRLDRLENHKKKAKFKKQIIRLRRVIEEEKRVQALESVNYNQLENKYKNSNPSLSHILRIQDDINQSKKAFTEKVQEKPKFNTEFPKSRLGRNLSVVAQFISTNASAPVIKVTHGGFDTHNNQLNKHNRLLKELGDAVLALRNSMKETGHWNDVLVVTYSEFGRRAHENNSRGTDHGTAAPHFVFGGKVNKGVYGKQPSLNNLDRGDLKYTTDFKSFYRTIAKKWWGQDHELIQNYPVLPFI